MANKALPVEDKTADRWIKVIGLVSIVTFPLIGTIGSMMIHNQRTIDASIVKTIRALGEIKGSLNTNGSKISRNEKDIRDISVLVDGNSQRIYKLEGAK